MLKYPPFDRKGVHNPVHKLDADKVREIRLFKPFLRRRVTIAELARRYGVAGPTIKDVLQGKTWTHVL